MSTSDDSRILTQYIMGLKNTSLPDTLNRMGIKHYVALTIASSSSFQLMSYRFLADVLNEDKRIMGKLHPDMMLAVTSEAPIDEGFAFHEVIRNFQNSLSRNSSVMGCATAYSLACMCVLFIIPVNVYHINLRLLHGYDHPASVWMQLVTIGMVVAVIIYLCVIARHAWGKRNLFTVFTRDGVVRRARFASAMVVICSGILAFCDILGNSNRGGYTELWHPFIVGEAVVPVQGTFTDRIYRDGVVVELARGGKARIIMNFREKKSRRDYYIYKEEIYAGRLEVKPLTR